jgi:hypothetical protein
MRSPNEYEAAFYAETRTPTLTPSPRLETPNRASNKAGESHSTCTRVFRSATIRAPSPGMGVCLASTTWRPP